MPAGPGAAQPDLSPAGASALLLSWVEKDGQGQRLRLARYAAGAWGEPLLVAEAEAFGNSVDPPHVRASADGALWAQWLRKPPSAAGHVRDVVLARSADGGRAWSAPQLVNLDGTHTEHGFVAMWPEGPDAMHVAWLDGRATLPAPHGPHHGPAGGDGGATMVRAARFDATFARSGETEVDARSCDCCQMDAAALPRGTLLAYRDRSEGEVRDIAVASLQGNQWSAPRPVHADGWVMAACPVNGPAIATRGEEVAVAWYTGAGDSPRVRLAFSADAGASFGAPVELASGAAVLGNVDVALDAGFAWVLWLQERSDGQSLWLARVARQAAASVQRVELAQLRARGRGAGVPRLVLLDGRAHVLWTDAENSTPALHGAVVSAR